MEVSATLCLKAALTHHWLYALVIGGYIVAFYALYLVMKSGMNVGVAYGVWTAAGVAITAVAAWLFFGEKMTWVRALEVSLIVDGILLVDLGA